MKKKQTLIIGVAALALLIPVAAQNVVKLPKLTSPQKGEMEKAVSTPVKADGDHVGGIMTTADREALRLYKEKTGQEPQTILRVPDAPEDDTVYEYTGFNMAAGVDENGQPKGGLVNFNINPFACDTVSSHSGVSQYSYMYEGKLHCILPTHDYASDKYTTIQRSIYDASTLEFEDIVTTEVPHGGVKSYVPYMLTYDNRRDVIYAVTMGDEQSGTDNYYLNIFDEKENKIKRIGYLGSWVSGNEDKDQYSLKALCAGYGTLYGLLASDAVYLVKINPADCSTTIIGKTDIPTNGIYGVQPMFYDEMAGSMIVNHYNLYDGTVYYKIATWASEGKVNTTLIEKAPTGFSFFYKRPVQSTSTAIPMADINDLTITESGENEITIDFTVPDKQPDGTPIEFPSWAQDYNKQMRVNVNIDNSYASVTGFPQQIYIGDHLTGTIDLQGGYTKFGPGLHTVTVMITNGNGITQQLCNSTTLVIGNDVPAKVENATATLDGDNVTIKWDAPLGSQYADWGTTIDLNSLTYTVIRDNDEKVVAQSISAMECTDKIEADEFQGYSYTVYAESEGNKGQGATTAKVFAGKYIVLPYSQEFTSKSCLEGWTILPLDDNGSYRTWQWNQYGKMLNSTWGENNDWIFTPPFKMEAGAVYELSAKIYGKGELHINAGTGNNVESMTNELATMESTSGEERVRLYFTPDADGNYNFGFHNNNGNDDNFVWSIYDLKVSKTGGAGAPASVTEMAYTPETPGSYNGKVTAKMPETDIEGNNIAGISAFVIYDADDQELARNESVTPGENAEVAVTLQHGWNFLKGVAVNEAGEGYPVSYKIYAGSDLSKPVTNLKAVWGEEQNQLKLSWNAPTEGVNGGWIDPENLSYKVYQYNPDEYPSRKELTELFENEVDVTILDNDKQDQYIVSVTAITAEGESDFANTSIVLGNPFKTPVKEPIGQEGFTISPYITTTNLGQGGWTVDYEYYNTKVKSANNDGVQLVFVNKGSGETAASIATPIIDFNGTTHPILSVWVHHTPGMDAMSNFRITATTNGHDYEDINEPVSLAGGNGWQQHFFDLSKLAGKKAQVAFKANVPTGKDRVFADNYAIVEATGNDLAITGISTTDFNRVGDETTIRVTVANKGAAEASDFTVLFNVNDETVEEKEVKTPLGIGHETVLEFPLTLKAGDNGETKYYAELITNSADDSEENNVSETRTVDLIIPQLPAPRNFAADNEQNLTWQAPEISEGHEVLLDFEDVPAFTIDNIEGWKTYDGDGHLTTSFVQYYENYWPYANRPLAWMVWSAKEAGCPDAAIWQPYEGDNCLIAWGNYGTDENGRDNSKELDDDWFISPQVLGGSEFSFMSASNDPSSLVEILVSKTDANPESFTECVKTIEYPTASEWKEVKCTLPSDAKYVALHVKSNGFGILVDNIRYTDARTPKLEGYNVYCGPEFFMFTKELMSKGTTTGMYGASALYDLGESAVSNRAGSTNGLDGTMADESNGISTSKGYIHVTCGNKVNVTVASIDGTVYFNNSVAGNLDLAVPAGIYVVKAGKRTAKLAVR